MTAQTVETEADAARAYRRHVLDLTLGLILTGVAGQDVAAAMTGASVWSAFATNVISVFGLGLTRWSSPRVPEPVLFVLLAISAMVTAFGLFSLNGGWDGTHLYPLLWAFSIVSGIGMYGAWPLTILFMAAGVLFCVGGKLIYPDIIYGVGADSSWMRVAAQLAWWFIALTGASLTGWRVIGVTRHAWQARVAVLAAQSEQHAWAAEAERLRLAVALERTATLTDFAGQFDAQVRTVVSAVAQISTEIGMHADAVSQAAGNTGERVRQAARLSAAVADDTYVVAQNAAQLDTSLTLVRGQAQGAAAAACAATDQVVCGEAALAALIAATGRVAEAIALIGVLAKQTNMLALNARIEAARAGDTGQGFTVVAAEVRGLAERTTSTAGDIDKLVREVRLAGETAAAALRSISQSIGQVSSFAVQVREATGEQANAVGSIHRTIASLNDKSGEVRRQVSDVASSAETTSDATLAMLAATSVLARGATELQSEAGAFITRVRAV